MFGRRDTFLYLIDQGANVNSYTAYYILKRDKIIIEYLNEAGIESIDIESVNTEDEVIKLAIFE